MPNQADVNIIYGADIKSLETSLNKVNTLIKGVDNSFIKSADFANNLGEAFGKTFREGVVDISKFKSNFGGVISKFNELGNASKVFSKSGLNTEQLRKELEVVAKKLDDYKKKLEDGNVTVNKSGEIHGRVKNNIISLYKEYNALVSAIDISVSVSERHNLKMAESRALYTNLTNNVKGLKGAVGSVNLNTFVNQFELYVKTLKSGAITQDVFVKDFKELIAVTASGGSVNFNTLNNVFKQFSLLLEKGRIDVDNYREGLRTLVANVNVSGISGIKGLSDAVKLLSTAEQEGINTSDKYYVSVKRLMTELLKQGDYSKAFKTLNKELQTTKLNTEQATKLVQQFVASAGKIGTMNSQQLQAYVKSLEQLKVSLSSIGVSPASKVFQKIDQEIKKGNASLDQMSSKLGAVNTMFGSIGNRIKTIFNFYVARQFLFTLYSLSLESVKLATNLEQAFKNVQAIMKLTNAETEQVKNNIFEIALLTGQDIQELADSFADIARSGFSLNQSLSAVKASAILAKATMSDMKTSVDTVILSMKAFDISARRVDDAINQIVTVVNNSKLSLKDFTDAFKNVGAIAGTAGLDLGEVASAIGTLSDAGIQASKAGTYLRSTISLLLKPTEGFKRTLEEVGLGLGSVDLETQGLAGALENLNKAGFNSFNAVKYAFNSMERRMASSLAILTGDYENFKRLLEAPVENTATLVLVKQLDTVKTTFQVLARQLQIDIVNIIHSNGELIKSLAVLLKGALVAIGGFSKLIKTIGGVNIAFGVLALGVARVVKQVFFMTTAFKLANATMLLTPWGIFLRLAGAVAGVYAVVNSTSKSFKELNAELAKSVNIHTSLITNYENLRKQLDGTIYASEELRKSIAEVLDLDYAVIIKEAGSHKEAIKIINKELDKQIEKERELIELAKAQNFEDSLTTGNKLGINNQLQYTGNTLKYIAREEAKISQLNKDRVGLRGDERDAVNDQIKATYELIKGYEKTLGAVEAFWVTFVTNNIRSKKQFENFLAYIEKEAPEQLEFVKNAVERLAPSFLTVTDRAGEFSKELTKLALTGDKDSVFKKLQKDLVELFPEHKEYIEGLKTTVELLDVLGTESEGAFDIYKDDIVEKIKEINKNLKDNKSLTSEQEETYKKQRDSLKEVLGVFHEVAFSTSDIINDTTRLNEEVGALARTIENELDVAYSGIFKNTSDASSMVRKAVEFEKERGDIVFNKTLKGYSGILSSLIEQNKNVERINSLDTINSIINKSINTVLERRKVLFSEYTNLIKEQQSLNKTDLDNKQRAFDIEQRILGIRERLGYETDNDYKKYQQLVQFLQSSMQNVNKMLDFGDFTGATAQLQKMSSSAMSMADSFEDGSFEADKLNRLALQYTLKEKEILKLKIEQDKKDREANLKRQEEIKKQFTLLTKLYEQLNTLLTGAKSREQFIELANGFKTMMDSVSSTIISNFSTVYSSMIDVMQGKSEEVLSQLHKGNKEFFDEYNKAKKESVEANVESGATIIDNDAVNAKIEEGVKKATNQGLYKGVVEFSGKTSPEAMKKIEEQWSKNGLGRSISSSTEEGVKKSILSIEEFKKKYDGKVKDFEIIDVNNIYNKEGVYLKAIGDLIQKLKDSGMSDLDIKAQLEEGSLDKIQLDVETKGDRTVFKMKSDIDLSEVYRKLNQLAIDANNAKVNVSGSTTVEKKQTGGFISGYGGGDRIPALLERGEFVLRKEAVRKFGFNFLDNLNRMKLPTKIPKFKEGGLVSSATNYGTVTFEVGGGQYPVQGNPAVISELVSVFNKLKRSGGIK